MSIHAYGSKAFIALSTACSLLEADIMTGLPMRYEKHRLFAQSTGCAAMLAAQAWNHAYAYRCTGAG